MANRRTGKASDNNGTQRLNSPNPQAAQQAGGAMNDSLTAMSVALKDSMKQVVVPQAFLLLMNDFANGDYGDLTPAFIQALMDGMCAPLEAQYQLLLEGGTTTQAALPSFGESTGISSSTYSEEEG